MQIGLYADKQDEKSESKIENKQTFNLPDLGLSSALGLLTPDASNKEEEQQMPVKKKRSRNEDFGRDNPFYICETRYIPNLKQQCQALWGLEGYNLRIDVYP